MKVRLYIRIRLSNGTRQYADPVYASNGRLKPFYAMIGSGPEHHPEGVYHLRFLKGGKRVWESVGSGADREWAARYQAGDVTTLADGQGTRYRAELNVKLPSLDTMTPGDVKKSIETVVADPAVASAVESKAVKLGMSPDEVKQSLGNPGKIVDLGAKQVFIFEDSKIILLDCKVSDAQ